MTNRSRRQIKKLHRHWMGVGVIDATQVAYWRGKLFDSRAGEVFEISRADVSGLPLQVAAAIRKFGLRFSVAVVDPAQAAPWLSEGGLVVFKFWATDFPTIVLYSGSNPAVR
jgi:hypothetical protein